MSKEKNKSIGKEIINLNPEPLGLYTLPQELHLKYKKKIELILQNSPKEYTQKLLDEPFLSHICNVTGQNLFKVFPELNDLKEIIKKILISYINEIGYLCDEVVINSAWLNQAEKNATLRFHNHSNSYVSGNYFVNFNQGEHSPLNFLNDRGRLTIQNAPTMTLLEDTKRITPYNVTGNTTHAKEGQILIWRSHMSHGYTLPNKSANRITLSFNSMPRVLNNGAYKFNVSD